MTSMTASQTAAAASEPHGISFGEAVRVWTRIALLSFGGARTGLFVPELKTLFAAVPARGRPAAIWALRVKG